MRKFVLLLGFLVVVGLAKACVNPYDNMVVTNDTILCRGTYNMNTSITVQNGTLYCNETVLVGDGTFDGIYLSSDGVSVKKTSDANFGCRLVNFSMGVSVPPNLRDITIEDVIFEGLTAGGTQLVNTTFTIRNLKAYNFESKAILLQNSTGYLENIYGENLSPESVLGIWDSVDSYIRINNLTAVNSTAEFGMNNKNVTVDFMDSWLECVNTDYGFTLSEVENVTIKNINAKNCGWSIFFDHSNDIVIKNVVIINSTIEGIELDQVERVSIENVYIDCWDGIKISDGDQITIRDSIVHTSWKPIYATDCKNVSVYNNDIISDTSFVYFYKVENLSLNKNNISARSGLYLSSSSGVSLYGNDISGEWYSVSMSRSNNTLIYDNVLRDSKYCLKTYNIENLTMFGNTITDCDYAYFPLFLSGETIFKNIVFYNNSISVNNKTTIIWYFNGSIPVMENVMRIDSDSDTPYMDVDLSTNTLDLGTIQPNTTVNTTLTLYVNTNMFDDKFEITGADIGSIPLSNLNLEFEKINPDIDVVCKSGTPPEVVDCSLLDFKAGMTKYTLGLPSSYLDILPSLDNTIKVKLNLKIPSDLPYGVHEGTIKFKVSGDVSDEETLTVRCSNPAPPSPVTFMSVFPLGALLFGILVPIVFTLVIHKLMFEKYELTFSGMVRYIMVTGVMTTLLVVFLYYIVYFITQPA